MRILKNRSKCVYLASRTLYALAIITIIIYEIAKIRYPNPKVIERPLSFQKLAEALQNLSKINYTKIVEIARDIFMKVPREPILEQHLDGLYDLISKNIRILD